MSPVGGVNPLNNILQDVLQEAQRHGGGHGGHGRVRQVANAETPEATQKSGQVQSRLFTQVIKEAEEEQPAVEAEEDPEALADRDGEAGDEQQQRRQQERDAEDEAARVLAEWQAMNPGQFQPV